MNPTFWRGDSSGGREIVARRGRLVLEPKRAFMKIPEIEKHLIVLEERCVSMAEAIRAANKDITTLREQLGVPPPNMTPEVTPADPHHWGR